MTHKFQNLPCPSLVDHLTVEAWVRTDEDRPEALQALVSKWTPLDSFGAFEAFDASRTGGLNATGYFGAVFDGRYVYFVPEKYANQENHAVVLRYDTHGDFHDPRSYAAQDASRTSGLATVGYYGAAFDGHFVYFIPRQLDSQRQHSHLLRLDTRREFQDPAAWDAFDIGPKQSSQSAAFDGRYLYLCPGYTSEPGRSGSSSLVIRHDTRGDFKDPAGYRTFDVSGIGGLGGGCFDGGAFDGQYVYFVPLQNSVVLRFDSRESFDDAASWQAFDARKVGLGMCVGAVFDGRFLYFVPYSNPVAVRYDTRGDFLDARSWEKFNVDGTEGLRTNGFDGGFFDGRYVTFVPFVYPDEKGGYVFHCNFLRYDTQAAFQDASGWSAHDASRASGLRSVGYNGGAFDGRFFYAAPWRRAPDPGSDLWGVHGTILRYDTLGTRGSFSLRYCDYGHNGGLCAAVCGPSFLVNTYRGVLSVAAHQALRPGRHHLKGVYNTRTIELFVDGERVGSRSGSGRIQENSEPVSVGQIHGGLGHFRGVIEDVRISAQAADQARP